MSNNTYCKIMPHGKTEGQRAAQRWEPMTDAAGAVVVATGADGTAIRAVPCGVIARLIAAFAGCFASVAHGVRLVDDAATGAGSPCFIPRQGFATGSLYVYAAGTVERVCNAFAREGITVASVNVESKGKVPGATVTLPPDADASACMRALRALGGSTRPPLGWQAQPLPKVEAVPPVATVEADTAPPKVKHRKKQAEA